MNRLLRTELLGVRTFQAVTLLLLVVLQCVHSLEVIKAVEPKHDVTSELAAPLAPRIHRHTPADTVTTSCDCCSACAWRTLFGFSSANTVVYFVEESICLVTLLYDNKYMMVLGVKAQIWYPDRGSLRSGSPYPPD